MDLTILILCLNEEKSIAQCVREATRFLRRNAIVGEVLVLDNGSEDGSAAAAHDAGARVVSETRRGYGRAIISGVAAARGRFVVLGDGDGEHDLDNLDAFWAKLQDGYALVVGNRFAASPGPGATRFLNRYVGAPLLSAFGRLLTPTTVRDLHCGLRAFDRQKVLGLKLRAPGMECASEMIIKAARKNLRIAEVPVSQRAALNAERTPHLRVWRDGWRHLRLLLLSSPRWLFLRPGCLSIVVGATLMVVPLVRADWLGTYAMLLGAGIVICGAQVLWFALFAGIHGGNQGKWSRWLLRDRPLKRLLAAGFGLGVLGFAGSVWSVVLWASANDPALSDDRLRVAIPSVMLLVLAVQFVFSGFMLTFLTFEDADARPAESVRPCQRET